MVVIREMISSVIPWGVVMVSCSWLVMMLVMVWGVVDDWGFYYFVFLCLFCACGFYCSGGLVFFQIVSGGVFLGGSPYGGVLLKVFNILFLYY